MKPTAVSLFAGCGGSSLGYHEAGFDVRLAVEWDSKAAATYRLNFPDTTVREGDIADLGGDEALRLAGLTAGGLDLLDGSPPCQGFSTAGQRRYDDPRNGLFAHYVRLLTAFQPRAFVMENVSGLRKGKMRLAFAEIHRALKSTGYRVSCRELNAWWYGVPQDRRRLIWVGIRGDLGVEPSHPKPTCRKAVTVAEAFRDLPPDDDAFTVPATTKIWKAMRTVAPGGHRPGHYSHVRLSLNAMAKTIMADWGFGHYHFWHPVEHRVITFREALRLCGFPDRFSLASAAPGEKWAMIGNSVPPPITEAIGRHVLSLLATPAEREAVRA